MDINKRLELIKGLVESIEESSHAFTEKYNAGEVYELEQEHSVNSMITRCKIARRELLMFMKELEKC